MPQTYSLTAPNGKTLDVTGDHVPTEAELHEIFKAAGVDTTSTAPAPSAGQWVDGPLGKTWRPAVAPARDRQDASGVGIDHAAIANRIANWASTLHPSLQKPAAFLATLPADAVASLVELFSAPESVATAGAKPALAAMDATGAAAAATGRAAMRVVASPATRKAAAAIVKHSLTAAGAHLGGAPGAIVGSTLGEEIAGAIRPPPAGPAVISDVSPPGVDRYMPNVSGAPPPGAPTLPPATMAPTEFQAAQAARQAANTLPDQRALNEAAIAARRAAYQKGQAPPPPAGPVVKASGKMQLTGPEFTKFNDLVKAGTSYDDAYAQLMADRFPGSITAAQRDAEIKARVGNKSPTR